MAQRVRTQLVDDLDGTEAHETVRFGLDRKSLEIDLSSDNAERLRNALAEFVDAARVAGGRRRSSQRTNGKRHHMTPVERASSRSQDVPPVAFSALPETPATPRTAEGGPVGSSHPPAFSAEVREWAKSQGLAVSDRGRIPRTVIEAYQSRTGSKPKARPKKVR